MISLFIIIFYYYYILFGLIEGRKMKTKTRPKIQQSSRPISEAVC